MSVHYDPNPPHWDYSRLAEKHRAAVVKMGARYGFDDIDSEETGWRISLKMSLGGYREVNDDGHLKAIFLNLCKYDFLKRREQRKEMPISFMAAPDEGYLKTVERLSERTNPRQENYTLYMQCMRALAELPKNSQRVMRKIARGDDAVEIAINEGRDIREVLFDLRIAREWLREFTKNG